MTKKLDLCISNSLTVCVNIHIYDDPYKWMTVDSELWKYTDNRLN